VPLFRSFPFDGFCQKLRISGTFEKMRNFIDFRWLFVDFMKINIQDELIRVYFYFHNSYLKMGIKWMTSLIFVAEQFSKFLEKARPGKNAFCGLNFSGHLNIELPSLGIKNLRIEYFRANCTEQFKTCLVSATWFKIWFQNRKNWQKIEKIGQPALRG
jgi:hypothetical protein